LCTAVTYQTEEFYFGRTLDNPFSYGEHVTITPRSYPFSFLRKGTLRSHYAMIGMAYVVDSYPLYYDACNEKGLAMAGLNFVGNAWYGDEKADKDNIAQYELIPWILSQCSSLQEAKALCSRLGIMSASFRHDLPCAELHWIIADQTGCIVAESTKEGLMLIDNPVGVLTNNPPFPMQMQNLFNFRHLSAKQAENRFSKEITLAQYSSGMGAIGLPGDLSSQSRFVRAAFTKLNSKSGDEESESVGQLFHILRSAAQQKGCNELSDGSFQITQYTSCMNVGRGIYYYTTYNNSRITAVDMRKEVLNTSSLICYPLREKEDILYEN